MTKDWIGWHASYDAPGSSLARRLDVVRAAVATAINDVSCAADEAIRIISMCAGDGRDLLPVVVGSERGRRGQVLLVEMDARLCARARDAAAASSLSAIEVRCADAGLTDAYLDFAPAHVLLCCGVFGNVTISDVQRTIGELPSLVVPGGFVIWTRGRGDAEVDPSASARESFAAAGFAEVSFAAPADANYRVGVHRAPAAEQEPRPLRPGVRLFRFVDHE